MSGTDFQETGSPKEHFSTQEQPTPEYFSKILFLSFKFSQGRSHLQEDIFQYIHTQYPNWVMPDSLRDQIYALVKKPIHEVIRPAQLAKSTQKPVRHASSLGSLWMSDHEDSVTSEMGRMQAIFNGEIPIHGNLVERITEDIITKDYEYLSREEGRERLNIPEAEKRHPSNDSFLSHFCHYGILGRPTGVDVLDEMFKEITSYAQKNVEALDDRLKQKIKLVKEIYNKHHPTTQIAFPI